MLLMKPETHSGTRAVKLTTMCVGIMCALSLASASAGATRSDGWSPTTSLSHRTARGSISAYPGVGIDGRGNVVVAWQEQIGQGQDGIVTDGRSAANRGWTGPAPLSAGVGNALFPRIAVSPRGPAVVVWQSEGLAGPSVVTASTRLKGQAVWSVPVSLSGGSASIAEPDVAIRPDGSAVAIWVTDLQHGVSKVETASLSAETTQWSRPAVVASATVQLSSPAIVAYGSGQAVAVWRRPLLSKANPFHAGFDVEGAVRPGAPKLWRRSQILGIESGSPIQSGLGSAQAGPQLAADAKGDAIVVWQGQSGIDEATWNARRDRWRVRALAPAGAGSSPDVALNANGFAAIVWLSASNSVQAATGQVGRCCWAVARSLSTGSSALYPQVALSASRTVFVAWSTPHYDEIRIRSRESGAWAAARKLGGGNAGPISLGVTAHLAVAAWSQPGLAKNGRPNETVEEGTYTAGRS
jgi:hypothetical protein